MKKIYYYGIVFLLSAACIAALWNSVNVQNSTHVDQTLRKEYTQLDAAIQSQIDQQLYTHIQATPYSYCIYSGDTLLSWHMYSSLPRQICARTPDNTILADTLYRGVSYCISLENRTGVELTPSEHSHNGIAQFKSTTSRMTNALLYMVLFLLVYISGVKLLSYLPRMTEFVAITLYSIVVPWIHASINAYTIINTDLSLDLVGVVCLAVYFLALSRILNKGLIPIRTKVANLVSYLIISASVFGYYVLIHQLIQHSSLFTLSSTAIQYSIAGMLFLTSVVSLGIALFFLHYSITTKVLQVTSLKERYLYQGLSVGVTVFAFSPFDTPILGIAAFVIAYLLILDLFTEYRRSTLIYGFWWLILLSGFVSASTYKSTVDKDRRDRRSYVKGLYRPAGISGKSLATEISHRLLNSEVFTPLAELSGLNTLDGNDYKSYIINHIGLDTILSKSQSINIYGYDHQNTSLFSSSLTSMTDIGYELSVSERIDDRILHNPFSDTYYLLYDIENKVSQKPHKVIIALKQEHTGNEGFDAFGYTIYRDSQAIYSSNIETYTGSTRQLISAREDKFYNEYSYIIERPSSEIKIVSFKKTAGIIRAISLFSLVLALASFISLILTYVNKRWQVIPHQIAFDGDDDTSLRRKIQTSIILLIVFSFIIIGIVTTYYFKNVLDTDSRQDITKSNFLLLRNIKHSIEGADSDVSAAILLHKNLEHIEEIHKRDIIVYDTDLLTTSKAVTYGASISMHEKHRLDSGIAVEQIVKDNHRIVYPLFHASNRPYAYASIDSTNHKSKNSILDFLSTILNVYVFLFLTASALAIGISNSITKPLTKLAEKLKGFKLGRQNATIEWNTKDEIGILINDYNNLVVKLQESADIIAKTHRDTAWREMAKQVAHEIKNPLTPMKLTIQYLDKKIKAEPDNAEAVIARASSTLIEQIDNLSRIADEFSNFATMPKTDNETVILNEVVETIHDLFRKREDINITLQLPIQDVTVFADKNQLSRVLINIVKNAIQAIPTDRKGRIDIHLYIQKDNAIIEVSDNGSGISDEMKDKVFEPNFTTKNSGTGLGLAMSANIIEAFNGKLYFETECGVGTSFYIEVPLMRLESNYDGVERVSLD